MQGFRDTPRPLLVPASSAFLRIGAIMFFDSEFCIPIILPHFLTNVNQKKRVEVKNYWVSESPFRAARSSSIQSWIANCSPKNRVVLLQLINRFLHLGSSVCTLSTWARSRSISKAESLIARPRPVKPASIAFLPIRLICSVSIPIPSRACSRGQRPT
jgi:hypothetical protein